MGCNIQCVCDPSQEVLGKPEAQLVNLTVEGFGGLGPVVYEGEVHELQLGREYVSRWLRLSQDSLALFRHRTAAQAEFQVPLSAVTRVQAIAENKLELFVLDPSDAFAEASTKASNKAFAEAPAKADADKRVSQWHFATEQPQGWSFEEVVWHSSERRVLLALKDRNKCLDALRRGLLAQS